MANGGTLNDLAVLDRLFGQPLANVAWFERNIGVSQKRLLVSIGEEFNPKHVRVLFRVVS